MKYFADTSFNTTIDDPILLLRKDGLNMVEAAGKRRPFWQPSNHQNNKHLTGDDIFWDEITEEKAYEILNRWKTELNEPKTD